MRAKYPYYPYSSAKNRWQTGSSIIYSYSHKANIQVRALGLEKRPTKEIKKALQKRSAVIAEASQKAHWSHITDPHAVEP